MRPSKFTNKDLKNNEYFTSVLEAKCKYIQTRYGEELPPHALAELMATKYAIHLMNKQKSKIENYLKYQRPGCQHANSSTRF